MSLRPSSSRWFEVLVARDESVAALEALSRTDVVAFEIPEDAGGPVRMPELRAGLEEYRSLAGRYEAYWPREDPGPAALGLPPHQILAKALSRLRQWREETDPLIDRLSRLRERAHQLALWRDLLGARRQAAGLATLAMAGPFLQAHVFALPREAVLERRPDRLILQQVATSSHVFLIALGEPSQVAALGEEVAALSGEALAWPVALAGGRELGLAPLEAYRRELIGEAMALGAALDSLQHQHRLQTALADLERLEWFMRHASPACVSERMCWITGWTSDPLGWRLTHALRRAHVQSVPRLVQPPEGLSPPTTLRNPWWARPFEVFPALLGGLGPQEADPTAVLAVVVPALFGYMFGDVGHGLLLVGVGLIAQRRWPAAQVFVPCGISAALFGLVFGGVFGMHHMLPPLWVDPLDQPLQVLIVPVFAGAGLLLLGLLLRGVEAYWRGEWRAWMMADAALVALYLGLLASPWQPYGGIVALAGLLWYLGGTLWAVSGKRARALGRALAGLFETTGQLLLNTLSFARVGAFALAHAALSLAVVTLAQSIQHPAAQILAFVLGNVLVTALEAFVVSVQTARLVLFEFFIRFLRAEGRIFTPSPGPGVPPYAGAR